jgi:hypothetical protein
MGGWDQNESWLRGVEWIQLAQDKGRWQAVVNAVMNIWALVPWSSVVVCYLWLCKNQSFCSFFWHLSWNLFNKYGIKGERDIEWYFEHISKYFQSEDKIKLTWNLDGCMVALERAIRQDYFPQETREMLQIFLSRQVIDVESNTILPHNWLNSLLAIL